MSNLPPSLENQVKRFRELQAQLQSVLLRKQQWQLNLTEYKNAVKELEKISEKDTVYRIVGPVMIEMHKDRVLSELNSNIELIEAKIKTLERQEKLLNKELKELQRQISAKVAGLRESK